jgi:hypothetical protein
MLRRVALVGMYHLQHIGEKNRQARKDSNKIAPQFCHPDEGGGTFLQNVGISKSHTEQLI